MYEFPSGDAVPSGLPNNTTPEPAHCHIPLCVRVAGLYFGIRIFADRDARGRGARTSLRRLGLAPIAVRMPRNARAVPVHAFVALDNVTLAVGTRPVARPKGDLAGSARLEPGTCPAHRDAAVPPLRGTARAFEGWGC